MPNRRRSSGQRVAPKLFRCTGYGNCDMVFTRSEHLARHERKHTGEKPYKCVVPGCGRMFSRFDNMMQHTQTHEKNKKIISTSGEKVMSSNTTSNAHGHQQHHVRGPSNHISGMTPIKSDSTTSWIEQQPKQSMPDLVMATSSAAAMTGGVPPLEHSSMINSRTLPLPRRASFSTAGYNDNIVYPQPVFPTTNTTTHQLNSNAYRFSYPPTTTTSSVGPSPPYYYNNYDPPASAYPYYTAANNIPRNRSSWPVKRDPYPQHYQHHHQQPQPAPYYKNDDHFNTIRRRSSVSTLSSDSSSIYSPTAYQPQPLPQLQQQQQQQDPQIVRRRISIDDLRLPIENLRNIQLDEERKSYYKPYTDNSYMNNNNNSVDITPDEYEALEGFSKFHSNSVIARDGLSAAELTPSPVLRTSSPNIAAQVCAMRQRVMPYNESFQRR